MRNIKKRLESKGVRCRVPGVGMVTVFSAGTADGQNKDGGGPVSEITKVEGEVCVDG